MKSNRPRIDILRWTLTAALACAATGCDDGSPISKGEIDLYAAREKLDEKADGQPLAPEELDELVIEEPTVRDIVEGRVDGPKLSASFARVDESGEAVEPCPQHEAALAGEPVEEARDIPFDATNERLLATPLAETCLLADRRTDSVELVRCNDYEGPDARATLDADFDLVRLDDPAAAEPDCYFCVGSIFCGWGGSLKKMGNVFEGYCISAGYWGCC